MFGPPFLNNAYTLSFDSIATEVKVSALKSKMSISPILSRHACMWTDGPGYADTDHSHKCELFPFTNQLHLSVSTRHFALTSDQELAKLAEGIVLENTSK